jgi:hypothetical protein
LYQSSFFLNTKHARHDLEKNPLTPLLFVVCIEALNNLFRLADTRNLYPLRSPAIKYRLSLYADDLVAFATPVAKDVMLVRALLDMFAAGHDYKPIFDKCQITLTSIMFLF